MIFLVVVAQLPTAGVADNWVPVAEMTYTRSRHTATVLRDGRVLVIGGIGFDRSGTWHPSIKEAEIYEPVSNVWTSAGMLREPRNGHTATLLADGRVLVAGGSTTAGPRTVEIFDPDTGAWVSVAPLSVKRSGHTATRLQDGRVLIAGGCCEVNPPIPLRSAETYDPVADTWTTVSPMKNTHLGATATLLTDGRVLVVGGQRYTFNYSLTSPAPMDGAEIYDPVSGAWSFTSDNVEQWTGQNPQAHRANLLPDGSVLISGGCCLAVRYPYPPGPPPGQGDRTPDVHMPSFVYDPRDDSWLPTFPRTPRSRHAAVTLPDGRVMVIGGLTHVDYGASLLWVFSRNLAETEIYDLRTRTWSDGPSMRQTRLYPAAVLLNDGRVMVVGGEEDDNGNYLRTSEILDDGRSFTGQDDAGSGRDAGNTFETASELEPMGPFTGRLDAAAGDRHDYFRFTLTQGEQVSVLVDTNAVTTDPMELIDPNGVVVDIGFKASSVGVTSSAVFTNEAPRVRLAVHHAAVPGEFRLHLQTDKVDMAGYTLCFMSCERVTEAPIDFVFPPLKHPDVKALLIPPLHGDLGNPLGPTVVDYLQATLRGIGKWEGVMDRFASDYPEFSYLREISVRAEIFDGAHPVDPAGYDVILGYLAAGPVFRGIASDADDSVEEVLSEWGLGDDVRFNGRVIGLSLFGSSPRAGQVLYDFPEVSDLETVTTHEFAHTFGLGHTVYWDQALGYDLMTSPAPFVYGDGSPVGSGAERTTVACISSLDLVGMAELYRWIPEGSWYSPSESASLPSGIPYRWYC